MRRSAIVAVACMRDFWLKMDMVVSSIGVHNCYYSLARVTYSASSASLRRRLWEERAQYDLRMATNHTRPSVDASVPGAHQKPSCSTRLLPSLGRRPFTPAPVTFEIIIDENSQFGRI